MSRKRALAITLAAAGLIVLGLAADEACAQASAADSDAALSARAQAQSRSTRARTRIRVFRAYPYRLTPTDYPTPYPIEFPGPGAVRQCTSWLAQEFRPSGPVVVPKMSCWWVRG